MRVTEQHLKIKEDNMKITKKEQDIFVKDYKLIKKINRLFLKMGLNNELMVSFFKKTKSYVVASESGEVIEIFKTYEGVENYFNFKK
jgi:hypothetical protein